MGFKELGTKMNVSGPTALFSDRHRLQIPGTKFSTVLGDRRKMEAVCVLAVFVFVVISETDSPRRTHEGGGNKGNNPLRLKSVRGVVARADVSVSGPWFRLLMRRGGNRTEIAKARKARTMTTPAIGTPRDF